MCSADSQAYLLDTAHSAVLRSDGCGWDTTLSPERPTEHQELEQHKKYRPHAATANMTLSSTVSTRASKITHTHKHKHTHTHTHTHRRLDSAGVKTVRSGCVTDGEWERSDRNQRRQRRERDDEGSGVWRLYGRRCRQHVLTVALPN